MNKIILSMQEMSKGNMGAITTLCSMMETIEKAGLPNHIVAIDEVVGTLKSCEVFGTDIYVLWNDICDRNTYAFIGIVYCVKLNIISVDTFKDACGRQDYSGRNLINVNDCLYLLKEKIKTFNIELALLQGVD